LDSFNVKDEAIRLALSGGVTTILALPGSANIMGGEAFAFKLRAVQSNQAEDMLLNYGIPGLRQNFSEGLPHRWMKMACGENPKGDPS
jgi:dihydroorotase-like cyclic amidohydrolase